MYTIINMKGEIKKKKQIMRKHTHTCTKHRE